MHVAICFLKLCSKDQAKQRQKKGSVKTREFLNAECILFKQWQQNQQVDQIVAGAGGTQVITGQWYHQLAKTTFGASTSLPAVSQSTKNYEKLSS